MDIPSNNHQLDVEEKQVMSKKLEKQVDDPKEEEKSKNEEEDMQNNATFPVHSIDNGNGKRYANMVSDSNLLSDHLGRDISIHCLLQLSRSDYGSIAALNKSFRSLIRSGELYKLRRKAGIVEHWVYFSSEALEWEAFDPNRNRWMHLPIMTCDQCFTLSDRESLAVGTELLVFGKELMAPIIHKYNFLTNMWSVGKMMNTPRCLFGSASLGEIAILAGGCDPRGSILSSAELYNADTGNWETLPNMNKARKMCSSVFMDGKFYVLGGIAADKKTQLTCGEEFDIKNKKWREIPNMLPVRTGVSETPPSFGSPPLIAVVKNVLYAADYGKQEVKKYDKDNNYWVIIGSFPEQATSVNGWGLAFRSCGDKLLFLGGRTMEINAWIPNEGEPQWNRLAGKQSGSYVRNCTVMGC
ncbi:putative galactose oxidase, beta-propeller [Medicago truncatula]|uniref:Galactose oxidase/kelch repeat protein n=1 Tax=Medicago truncatula TaxID=3880 RepID=A0A072TEQ9_MEDTR|nr:F-box/kelch-repeat protein SKIP11 [Medicago truncatula]KEH15842.1 galactose oxidase/kelch repeat protein [Medicago truncatula]RHN59149.1 putative galactose oxidase, beta-propeller [Medicago truncatula]